MFQIFLVFAGLGLLLLPVISLVLVLDYRKKQRELTGRYSALESRLQHTGRSLQELRTRVEALEPGERPVTPQEPAGQPAVEAPAAVTTPTPTASPPRTTPPPRPAPPSPTPAPTPTIPAATKQPASVPTRRWGLEWQLGTQVAVWIGAVALALAGGFLVKYTVERGLIGPTMRVALGLAFGVALLVGAEWIHRRYLSIAQGLGASGIAVLYAALLAGVRLYELIPPLVGLLGMLLTTATAVILSLRHGQMVAILGLLGGFLTPILIGGEEPRPWMLLTYLLLIQGGLVLVGRRKRWWPVTGLTMLGVICWAFLWMGDLSGMGGGTLPIGLLLLVSMACSVAALTSGARQGNTKEGTISVAMTWGSTGLGMLALSGLVAAGDFGWMEWTFLGVLGAGCLFLGRRDPAYEGVPWLSALAGGIMLFAWGLAIEPAQQTQLWFVAAALGALYIGGGYLALWGSPRPERWAALSGAAGILYLLVAFGVLQERTFLVPWGVQSLLLAGVYLLLLLPVARRRGALPNADLTLAALAVAVTALVSLAAAMELDPEWLAVAWALEIPALAWLMGRFRVPVLDKLAWALGGLVSIRLLLNPAVLTYPIGDGVLLNWLLYGYGVPIAAFGAGAFLFRRQSRQGIADALEAAAIVFAAALITLDIRQYFHPGDLGSFTFAFTEWGALVVAGLLYALGLFRFHRWTGRSIPGMLATAFGGLGLAVGIAVPGLIRNPAFHPYAVGEMAVFNSLLFVFGVPAILAALLAWEFFRSDELIAARVSGGACLAFAFLTVTLEVRQGFRGTLLSQGTATSAEMYSYSLAWVLFGTALLVAGILTRWATLRYGSALVMLLAVGKVFLVDTAHLEDLYRVFSFLGLGASLMLLAFLYQRYVFGESHR